MMLIIMVALYCAEAMYIQVLSFNVLWFYTYYR